MKTWKRGEGSCVFNTSREGGISEGTTCHASYMIQLCTIKLIPTYADPLRVL